MIKLTDLIKELEEIEIRPAVVPMPPREEDVDKLIQQGYVLVPSEEDPEVSKVIRVPYFKEVKDTLYKYYNEFAVLEQSSDASIKTNAKNAMKSIPELVKNINALERSIKLYKQDLKNK